MKLKKLILKFIWKKKRTKNTQKILKNKMGSLALSNIMSYNKAIKSKRS